MAQPVWTLSVDLQTKTATFTSGLADAAKSARGSFNEIKDGARTMGAETGYSVTEARHSVMLLGEEFGVHLPRALTSFIASLGPIGAAMEAAFPFLAIAVGATLLLEHLSKLKESGQALTDAQRNFGTAAVTVLNNLNDKLLEVGIRADELRGDHLAALDKQLQLIDHQSMRELGSEFEKLAGDMEKVFAVAERGSLMKLLAGEGAGDKVKAEFDKFKTQYEQLLQSGKGSEARGALVDEILQAQEQLKKYQGEKQSNPWVRDAVTQYQQLIVELEKINQIQDETSTLASRQQDNAKAEAADKEAARVMKAYEDQQRGLAEYLRHREQAESRLSALRKKAKQEDENAAEAGIHANDAFLKAMKEQETERAKLAQESSKEDAGHGNKMAELQLAADREAAQMRIAQRRVTGAEVLDMELSFSAREYNAKKEELSAELAGLDTYAKDYENKERALNNRLLELDKQFQNQDQMLEDQAQKKRLASIQSSESRMKEAYAQGFSQVLMGKESFGQMMEKLDEQMGETALKNLLMSAMQREDAQGRTRFGDARTAAAEHCSMCCTTSLALSTGLCCECRISAEKKRKMTASAASLPSCVALDWQPRTRATLKSSWTWRYSRVWQARTCSRALSCMRTSLYSNRLTSSSLRPTTNRTWRWTQQRGGACISCPLTVSLRDPKKITTLRTSCEQKPPELCTCWYRRAWSGRP
jgi:hypothetical protein